MTLHLLSHPGRQSGLSFLGSASSWAVGCLVAVFFAEVLWRGLESGGSDVPGPDWVDGLIVVSIVLGTSWLYVRRHAHDISSARLAAVGALWVLISVGVEYTYRVYGGDRYVVHLLLSLLLGDYRGSNNWLWDLFLAVQLAGPMAVGAVTHAAAPRRGRRSL